MNRVISRLRAWAPRRAARWASRPAAGRRRAPRRASPPGAAPLQAPRPASRRVEPQTGDRPAGSLPASRRAGPRRACRPEPRRWAPRRSSSPGGESSTAGGLRLRYVGDLDRGRLLRRIALEHLSLDALDAQREAAAGVVDLEDLDLELVAGTNDLGGALDVVLGELGDVDEALDAGQDLDEGAEGDDLGDLAVDRVALLVLVQDLLPRVLLGLLQAQGDPLAVAVDVEHLDVDGVADREDLGRMVDVAPGELGDVDQAVDALQVHEGAEVDDVRDLALDLLAGLELAEDLLADLLALLLEDRAAREDDVVAGAVELDHLALERLAHELVEVLDAADVDQRGGQEAADAEVQDQAALDDLDDRSLDGLAGLGGALDAAPGLLEAGALLGEDQAPFLVLLGEDEGVDLLAEVDLFLGLDRLADRKLVGGDDPLALVADVHQDLVLVDAHDLAVDDVALLEGMDRRVVVRDDLAVDLDQEVGGGGAVGGGRGGLGRGRRRPRARTLGLGCALGFGRRRRLGRLRARLWLRSWTRTRQFDKERHAGRAAWAT